ncbi:beta strand repeat-containing protein, partial [Psychrobacter sanguinis]
VTLTTVNGAQSTGAVAADGTFTIDVAGSDLAADADTVIDASVAATDPSGNVGEVTGSKDYAVDTAAPDNTTTGIRLDSITDDNIVNALEVGKTIAVTGKVTGEFKAGDVVTLTTVNGAQSTGAVAADGTFTIDVAGSDLAADADTVIDASVAATDPSGNVGEVTGSKDYAVDTAAPDNTTTGIRLDSITDDNIVNALEVGKTIAVTGKVTGEFKAGDVVTLTTVNGAQSTGAVAADGTFTIDVKGSDLAADGDTTIDASVKATDPSGNVGEVTGSKDYAVDTAAPDNTTTGITLNSITEDNIINALEARDTITVTGTVTGEFKAGDVVTLTTVNGAQSTGAVAADGTFTIDVEGNDLAADGDTTIDASVKATDPSGNVGEVTGSKDYAVDTAAPNDTTTGITLNSITEDNIINALEARDTITVTGTVTGEFKAGDVVTLTTVNGAQSTGAVAADGTFTIDVEGSDLAADGDTTIDASVKATDPSGNVGEVTGSKDYAVDTAAPNDTTTGITLNSITEDNIINALEARDTITVTGKVTGEFKAGDVVTLTTVNGAQSTGAVSADGTFTIDVKGNDLAADADTTIDATVKATDPSGNVGEVTGSKSYAVDDGSGNVVTLIVSDVTADNIINAVESEQTIAVTGKVSGAFVEGDVVTLTVNGVQTTGTVAADGRFSIDVAGSDLAADPDAVIDASVAATFPSGNSGTAQVTHKYGVDTVAPNKDTTDLEIDAITEDNIINAAEAGGDVAVT